MSLETRLTRIIRVVKPITFRKVLAFIQATCCLGFVLGLARVGTDIGLQLFFILVYLSVFAVADTIKTVEEAFFRRPPG